MKKGRKTALFTAACLACITTGYAAGDCFADIRVLSAAVSTIRGDVNMDGSVNVVDFITLKSILLGTDDYTEPIKVTDMYPVNIVSLPKRIQIIENSNDLKTYINELGIGQSYEAQELCNDMDDKFNDYALYLFTTDKDHYCRLTMDNINIMDDTITASLLETSADNSEGDYCIATLLVPRNEYNNQSLLIEGYNYNDNSDSTTFPPSTKPVTTATYKPVIYLYPQEKTDINVRLTLNRKGKLTYTYPQYPEDTGWNVTAEPDSTMHDKDGREYSYLFWESDCTQEWDMSKGFVVKGTDTVEFLQDKLEYLGLTPKEYNDFIVFWMPKMESNAYNFIAFQTDAYEDYAKLDVTPAPDSMQRVFMVFKPLHEYEEVEEQILEPFERKGYTVIEWGGAEIPAH
ncbi:MAG: hypothetical protein Q4F95_10700 [Oscillospiraceae bacterium]|nr:hypothetical protein [Oscillospiraceae bacterium]